MAIIGDEIETYAQYLYPASGLNWIQGDIGESGLPDVRAQAGFVNRKKLPKKFFSTLNLIPKTRSPKMEDSFR